MFFWLLTSNCALGSNVFNSFFTNIAPDIAKKIPKSSKLYKFFLQEKTLKSFYFFLTNENEVSKIINTFKNDKSAGPNSIPLYILQRRFQHHLSHTNIFYKKKLWNHFVFFQQNQQVQIVFLCIYWNLILIFFYSDILFKPLSFFINLSFIKG